MRLPSRGWTRRWLPLGAVAASGGETGAGTGRANGFAGEVAASPGRVAVGVGAGGGERSLVERVMAARGLCDAEAVARFLAPDLHALHDPELMPGMGAAVDRIIAAVRGGERIVIYGDYDVDGITATAVLYHALRTARPDVCVDWYVPHRVEEGYGLNAEALRQLRESGAQLVVSVDCGITAAAEAALAREIGLDLIISDHHVPPLDPAALPEAHAIVHPGLPGSAYPFRELCGAGVAFKLAWSFARKWCGSERVSKSFQQTLMRLLPLVALGTIADVVPLVGENRVLASFGLRLMGATDIPGLRALVDSARAERRGGREIDAEQVGFILGPRLNACGRMGHAADAVRLFTDAGATQAATIVQDLARLNRQRQDLERSIVEEACRLAEAGAMIASDHRAIVLAGENWHVGVLGIVCSRLVERYGRPVILLQKSGGVCRGSARSIDGFDLHAALDACAAHLDAFGGHAAAAGLTVAEERFNTFREAFVACANERIHADQLLSAVRYDCAAAPHEVTLDSITALTRLAPFGRGNPRPTLLVRGMRIAQHPRLLGTRHLKAVLEPAGPAERGEGGQRTFLDAVWWDGGEHLERLARGVVVDAVVEPRISTWSGRPTIELEIRDMVTAGDPAITPEACDVERTAWLHGAPSTRMSVLREKPVPAIEPV